MEENDAERVQLGDDDEVDFHLNSSEDKIELIASHGQYNTDLNFDNHHLNFDNFEDKIEVILVVNASVEPDDILQNLPHNHEEVENESDDNLISNTYTDEPRQYVSKSVKRGRGCPTKNKDKALNLNEAIKEGVNEFNNSTGNPNLVSSVFDDAKQIWKARKDVGM